MKTLDWLHKKDSDIVFCDLEDKVVFSQFRQSVTAVQAFLLSKKIKSCVLYNKNIEDFLVQLMACVVSQVDIILPANLTADISQAIQADCKLINCSIAELTTDLRLEPLQVMDGGCTLTLFTSGSTGKPKAISRRFSQLIEEVTELDKLWGHLSHQAIFAASVSQQHIYGLLFKVLWPFYTGAFIWRNDVAYEESLLQFTKQEAPVIFISSPAFLKRLQGDCQINYVTDSSMNSDIDTDTSSVIKQTFSSGGLLTHPYHKQTEDHLSSGLTQVYGSSETGGIAYRQLNTDWQFFPSVKHRINDGVLWVKSPFCFKAEWQNTQDQVIISNEGMQLVGRADNIAKIEDKRVSLSQLENQLMQHAWIQEAKVIVLENNKQMVAAVICLNATGKAQLTKPDNDVKCLKQTFKQYLKTYIEPVAIPRMIRFVDHMPTDSQGKVTWHILSQLFEH